jgi:hypothetical protein
MQFPRVLPLLVLCCVVCGASAVVASAPGHLVPVRVGLGVSSGLDSAASPSSGLALQVEVTTPVSRSISADLAFDRQENGLKYDSSEAEFKSSSFSGLLAYHVGGRVVSGYARGGFGIAYVRRQLRQPGPHNAFAILDNRSGLALSGQWTTGVDVALAGSLRGFVDGGIHHVWGGLAHTSGALVLGVSMAR